MIPKNGILIRVTTVSIFSELHFTIQDFARTHGEFLGLCNDREGVNNIINVETYTDLS